jgi:hypothetical protein
MPNGQVVLVTTEGLGGGPNDDDDPTLIEKKEMAPM